MNAFFTNLAKLLFAVILLAALYYVGVHNGAATCAAAHAQGALQVVVKTETKVKEQAKAEIKRGVAAGQQLERRRAAIDATFTHLESEAAHDAPVPVDSCVLPADRLRRWADANRGGPADQGAAASQPDDAASVAAHAGLGPDGGPGSEPPGGDEGLSPARSTVLQPAGVPRAER